jgi:hypothetical protein
MVKNKEHLTNEGLMKINYLMINLNKKSEK